MYRLIVAGGRDFNDYEKAEAYITKLISNLKDEIEFVSGNANGADKLGEQYARKYGYRLKLFPADWSKGLYAGPYRNEKMAIYASEQRGLLIAFWDGKSKGTKNMIDNAKKYNLQIRIINY